MLKGQGLVHRMLALYPLLRIGNAYKYVFEKVLDVTALVRRRRK